MGDTQTDTGSGTGPVDAADPNRDDQYRRFKRSDGRNRRQQPAREV
ncbi:hypothetical protein [Natronorubrum sp. DTA7]